MSTDRRIAHNTLVQLIGKVLSTLLGVIAIGILTRHLGAEKFGWYITASAFLQFVGVFTDFGFTLITSSMLAQGLFDRRKLFGTIFTWRLISALFFHGSAGALIFLFPYNWEIKLAVVILAISFVAAALTQVFIGYYQERLRMWVGAMGELLSRVLLVAGVSLVAWQGWGFLPTIVAVTIPGIIFTGYLWYKSEGVVLTIDKTISPVLFARLWPVALAIIFNTLYSQGDRLLLPLYVSQTEVGFYGAAYRILDVVLQTSSLITGLMLPLIAQAWSRARTEDFKKYFQLCFDLNALLLLPMLAGIFVLHTPIMRLIAGSEFAAAGAVLRLLALAVFGYCFGTTFGHIALAINRQRHSLLVFASNAIMSIIAYLIFIPRYGIFGAAGVTIFSELYAGVMLLFLVYYFTRYFPRLFTFSKIAVASGLMAGVLYYLQHLPLVISIALGGAVYIALIPLLRIVSVATIRELLSSRQVAEPE